MQRSSSFGGSSVDLKEPLDIRKLVNDVANQFQADHGIPISPLSREELIKPALPHREAVELALESGEITRDFLEESVRTVFENAKEIAQSEGRHDIGEDITRASMKRYCPYLFWC